MTRLPTAARRDLILSVLFAFTITLLAGGMAVYVMSDPGFRQATLLTSAALHIQGLYGGGEVDVDQMLESARQAMLDRLDRYSGYIGPTRFGYLYEEFSGKYGGIGVSVVGHEDGLEIMSIREGGPASQAGLLPGDIIIKADTARLVDLSFDDASRHLRGEAGTTVELTIERPAVMEPIRVEVKRADIDLLHIPYAGVTPDSVLYIRLLDFQAGATDDLEAALDSLAGDKTALRGIILDLRNNPGGLFSEAYRTADLLLPEGSFIVGTDARSLWDEVAYRAQSQDRSGGLPIVVLVNRGTASSAEIVAGALRSADRARLIGDTTFGKGLVQGFARFEDGSGLRLTISRYFVGDSLFLNEFDSTLNDTGHGLPPDRHVVGIETDPFPLALERSGILRDFAFLHADSLAEHPQAFELDRRWLNRLQEFAILEGFSYESPATAAVRGFVQTLETEQTGQPLLRASRALLDRSSARDREAFRRYRQHILFRMRQIAYERRHGVAAMYRDVIVSGRPEIDSARELLREMPRPGKPASGEPAS